MLGGKKKNKNGNGNGNKSGGFERKENTGSLFENDRKENDNQPDMTGIVNVAGTEYRIAGWMKESKNNGSEYLSLAFTELDPDYVPKGKSAKSAPAKTSKKSKYEEEEDDEDDETDDAENDGDGDGDDDSEDDGDEETEADEESLTPPKKGSSKAKPAPAKTAKSKK